MCKNFSTLFPVGSGIICTLKKGSRAWDFQEDNMIMINLCSSGAIKLSRPRICVCALILGAGTSANKHIELKYSVAWSKGTDWCILLT
jgi:hypothetical protein